MTVLQWFDMSTVTIVIIVTVTGRCIGFFIMKNVFSDCATTFPTTKSRVTAEAHLVGLLSLSSLSVTLDYYNNSYK